MSDDNTDKPVADPEAVYYAALGLLDELTPEQQCSVVSNWVKYICGRGAAALTPSHHHSIYPAFEFLCNQFAEIVKGLPKTHAKELRGEPCGRCISCLVEAMTTQSSAIKVVLQ